MLIVGEPGSGREDLKWILLGVHAGRMDVDRDVEQDERLNLNFAWYADVLVTLTDEPTNESQ